MASTVVFLATPGAPSFVLVPSSDMAASTAFRTLYEPSRGSLLPLLPASEEEEDDGVLAAAVALGPGPVELGGLFSAVLVVVGVVLRGFSTIASSIS